VHFFWVKILNAKVTHKEMFPVYGGKCLSRKLVYNCVDKFFQGRSNVADDVRPGAEVAERTVKRLLCCGFRRTGKAMGQVSLRITGFLDFFSSSGILGTRKHNVSESDLFPSSGVGEGRYLLNCVP
jgi:hypothetical protein